METNDTYGNQFEPGLEVFDFELYHNSSHERGFISSSRVGITICVGNFIINSLVLLLILCFQTTKKQFVMSQIANIAIMDILMCLCVDTVTIYHNIHPWSLGQTICEAWLVLDVLLPFNAYLGIILMNADRLMFAVKPSFYFRLFKNVQTRRLYLVIPWIISSVLIVPIWLLCDVPMQHIPFMCVYAITESAGTASSVVSLFVPSAIVGLLVLLLLVTLAYGLPKNLQEFHNLTIEDHFDNPRVILRRHNSLIIALCIVDVAALTMQLPFGTLSVMEPQCLADPCTSIIELMFALSWLRSATPGVRGLIWFLFTEIKLSCCFCMRSKYADSNRRPLVENVPMTSTMNTQHEQLISVSGCEKVNEKRLL
ncbi:hypothetical protein LOTGIDRAFT_152311 [Lottia gigantea]|uniref:G-protein coupled receptors family 1 profile domain-containing protein n=1 Tax=Lottia gigantea TaxID=225164 RepID=V4CSE7_LOTGI|nr:hypothetical protein LOTGIDRAFT_152311 [Lottia gigantea]ESP05455.1 hypothetical protein LOTGIDRAFT_152311 [Lottia gigantea]